MRKRTQLVGFEFGYWKHVQYCAEFIDNALDAIESFQWKELQKPDSKIKFSLDQELFLEKFSIVEAAKEEKKTQHLDNEAKHTLMQELGIAVPDLEETAIVEPETKEEESGEISDKDELEIEEEVQRIIEDMQEIIKPVENIIDVEPIVIVRIREHEAPSFLTSELSQKNVMSFIFEIFDNGTGMAKIDLRKFGKYLASSKSLELKQTRGSQGFGSPSAFSDAQNTTGKPIIAVSKSSENVYATATEFFTTSKNEKKYLIHPTDIDSPFLHGTYIKLNYLNVKYIKGYVEKYIEETAFMNPHITIIYIDPDGKEKMYRRLASAFPKEPKYAKPHPTSVNIGDLQDLISKSENKSIASFLKENFVRITSKTAREIIEMAKRDLQDNLNLLILKDGFISRIRKKDEIPYYLSFEKRVYGRSTKPRDKLIIYKVNSEDLFEKYWIQISKYNKSETEKEKINKEIRKLNVRVDKSGTLKEKRGFEKQIKALLNDIEDINKDKEKIKNKLNAQINTNKSGLIELKKIKNRTDFEDLVSKVQISKIKPTDITKEQFNSLFLAFKSMKYMSPPTETAIPVGDLILENTLIKEIGLRISEGIDDFDIPVENISQTVDIINEEKKLALTDEDIKIDSETMANLSINPEEVISLSSDILGNIDIVEDKLEIRQIQNAIDDLLTFSDIEPVDSYGNVFEYFIENYTKDDDFVSAETRSPTSGKGLAYVVEAVMAYSRNIEVPKRSRDVLSRFVNRTPKLRDSADCAITKAVQSVNWKNYKLETYDNNLPKGPIKLLVNVSGPFVHLMFKSQSKNALAEDENLIKEIKFCLESIGRRMRIYINRRASIQQNEKRASLIEKYIPIFSQSIYNIASKGESKFKAEITLEKLINSMKQAIGKKPVSTIAQELTTEKPEDEKEVIAKEEVKEEPSVVVAKAPKKEIEEIQPKIDKISRKTLLNWTVNELKTYCIEQQITLPSSARKNQIIEKILDSFVVDKISIKPSERRPQATTRIVEKPTTPKPPIKRKSKEVITPPKTSKPKSTQTTLPMITTDRILEALSKEWQTIKHLIFKLKIKDMMDARYLQLKLKELERKEEVLVEVKMGRKQWKLK